MYDVIHALSSCYGWSKKQILEDVYPDDIEPYLGRIRKGEASKNLTLLAIAHNPKVNDPQKLISQFESQISGTDEAYYTKETMDEEAENQMNNVRKVMKENAEKKKTLI